MKINFELLVVLCDLYKTVPVRTPKRLDIILEFTKIITESGLSCTRSVIIDLHDEEKMFQNSPFNLTMNDLARLEQNIPKLNLITQNRINTPEDVERHGGIGNVGIEGIDSRELADTLFNEYRIFTVGINRPGVHGLRITPNLYTTLDELDALVDAITELSA